MKELQEYLSQNNGKLVYLTNYGMSVQVHGKNFRHSGSNLERMLTDIKKYYEQTKQKEIKSE